MHADLHIHSAYSSDGELSPADIASNCAARGLGLFSVTDHNCVRAMPEAAEAARAQGLRFVPGIEIDCVYKAVDLHLLGYGVNWRSADFARQEEEFARLTLGAFGAMVDTIRRLGFAADANVILAAAGKQLPTAELIAEVLLSDAKYHTPPLAPYLPGGARSDMPYINFYLDFFAQGRPAYVPVEYLDYRRAVELVRDNGGIPVVAHPGLNFRGKERVAEELLEHGAAGLEVFNNYHTEEQIAYFAPLATRRKVLMTCGSDFHGKTKPRIGVGEFRLDGRYEEYLLDSVNHIDMVCGQGV